LKCPKAVDEAIWFGWIDSNIQSIDAIKVQQKFDRRRRIAPGQEATRKAHNIKMPFPEDMEENQKCN
jgi:hypothetical protein